MAGELAQTGTLIIDPLYTLWLSFGRILPGVIAAIIVLLIGYFVALILGHVVRIILEKIGLDAKVRKSRVSKAIGHTHLPNIIGEVVKWYIFIIFLQQAVALLNLGTLTLLLDRFVVWLPHVIAAILVVLFGFVIAHYIEIKIQENSKVKGVKAAASWIKVVIIVIMFIIALKQIGIETGLIENLILIIIGAFAVAMAIAFGIGLGGAMKPGAQKWVDSMKKNF